MCVLRVCLFFCVLYRRGVAMYFVLLGTRVSSVRVCAGGGGGVYIRGVVWDPEGGNGSKGAGESHSKRHL